MELPQEKHSTLLENYWKNTLFTCCHLTITDQLFTAVLVLAGQELQLPLLRSSPRFGLRKTKELRTHSSPFSQQ
jgi:hypothetical protein